ncbi:hypothetical protein GTW37_32790 [Streptomyces sp. SID4931]|nr:hypothetical protein [Streptomyces sp. SID4931]SCG07160.1 hypothetical protein GA0115255_122278 [Streptomyces sp. Ncost-T6T-2b]
MTTSRPSQFIIDAARPIAAALGAVGELRGVNVPSDDVLISYHHRGCTVRVAECRAVHRQAVEDAFAKAFTDAGWGVNVRQTGGLTLSHPVMHTRW